MIRRGRARRPWWGVDDGNDEAAGFRGAPGAASEGGFEGRMLAGPACDTLAAEAPA